LFLTTYLVENMKYDLFSTLVSMCVCVCVCVGLPSAVRMKCAIWVFLFHMCTVIYCMDCTEVHTVVYPLKINENCVSYQFIYSLFV